MPKPNSIYNASLLCFGLPCSIFLFCPRVNALVLFFNCFGSSLGSLSFSSSSFQESSHTQQDRSHHGILIWQVLSSPGLPHVLHSQRLVNWRCTISSPSCLCGTLLSQGQLHGMCTIANEPRDPGHLGLRNALVMAQLNGTAHLSQNDYE